LDPLRPARLIATEWFIPMAKGGQEV